LHFVSYQYGALDVDVWSNVRRLNGSRAAITQRNMNGRGTKMVVKVLSFSRSNKPAVLASVRIELAVDSTGDSIIIDDARVLRNRHGQLWLAMPSYSVPANGGRGYDYLPAVTLSTTVKRAVEDAVLPAFEEWEREQSAFPVQGVVR
jgi:DNA-binding cell septation regulator SpoVG